MTIKTIFVKNAVSVLICCIAVPKWYINRHVVTTTGGAHGSISASIWIFCIVVKHITQIKIMQVSEVIALVIIERYQVNFISREPEPKMWYI